MQNDLNELKTLFNRGTVCLGLVSIVPAVTLVIGLLSWNATPITLSILGIAVNGLLYHELRSMAREAEQLIADSSPTSSV